MQIKNSYNLNAEEIADLFEKLATSLRQSNSLKFEIKGNAAELEVGSNFETQLSFSDGNFALDLAWSSETEEIMEETGETDWRSEFDKDMAEAGIQVDSDEVTPEVIAPVVEEDVTVKAEGGSQVVIEKTLPDRVHLNTTTLSFDPGYWTSSFGLENQNSNWTEIEIDGDLENTKWSEHDDSLVAAPSIAPAKTIRRPSVEEGDDDLFSALDDLDEKPKSRNDRGKQKPRKVKTSGKAVASPIPSSKKVVADQQSRDWKEPTPEDNVTDDDWVKPSEFLKKNKAKNARQAAGIPAPASIPKAPGTKPSSIPSPGKKSDEIVADVQDWQEPQPETSTFTNVKPSDVTKEKKLDIPSPKGSDDPRFKKPPTAPDKKKDKKDKGWAKW